VQIILDTQIISYAVKGNLKESLPADFAITSTVAHEFLRVRDKRTGAARYYTPLPHGMLPDARANYAAGQRIHGGRRPSNRPLFKRVTDKVLMDFNNEYPSVVEYGHAGIAHLINTANRTIFAESITHLPKRERKRLICNFEFLADHASECIPLDVEAVSSAFRYLKELEAKGVSLKADFRNSLNDMLILATADIRGAGLRTMDGLLAQFARECGVVEVESRGGIYDLTPKRQENEGRKTLRESKGYRNTAWRYAIHRVPPSMKK
jgi:predicted nucleic acid-binding protein